MVKLSLNIASCIFTMRSRPRESDVVLPGDALPPIVDIDGWKIGVMTCYDVRFPETARSLAVRGLM